MACSPADTGGVLGARDPEGVPVGPGELAAAVAAILDGMPEPRACGCTRPGGRCVITAGSLAGAAGGRIRLIVMPYG